MPGNPTQNSREPENKIEFLGILAPERYTRNVDNVLASPNFEDVSLIDTRQDLSLVGLTWRRRAGEDSRWTHQIYRRANDKTSAEGEAYPDLGAERNSGCGHPGAGNAC
jgi:hypothetical protein